MFILKYSVCLANKSNPAKSRHARVGKSDISQHAFIENLTSKSRILTWKLTTFFAPFLYLIIHIHIRILFPWEKKRPKKLTCAQNFYFYHFRFKPFISASQIVSFHLFFYFRTLKTLLYRYNRYLISLKKWSKLAVSRVPPSLFSYLNFHF